MKWVVVYCDNMGKRAGEKVWDTQKQAKAYAVRIEKIGWVAIQIKKVIK